jgi:hypothetical protein
LTNLDPNLDEAIDFLVHMNPQAPLHLVAIPPDKKPIARTFETGDEAAARAWLAEFNNEANLYHHVNALTPDAKDIKAKKEDVAAIRHFHVDVDDLDPLARLTGFVPKPTAIIMSGGGYQA